MVLLFELLLHLLRLMLLVFHVAKVGKKAEKKPIEKSKTN